MNTPNKAYQTAMAEGRKRADRALHMHMKEGKSLSEIGAVLGVTRQRVAAMIKAARKRQQEGEAD